MNKFLLVFSVLVVTILSCQDDDGVDPIAYSFKDQDAQGKIGNVNWAYKTGFGDVDGDELYITLLATSTNPCEDMPAGKYITFYVGNKTGVQLLKLDWSNLEAEDNLSVTLFDDSDGMNYIATQGAIEIIAVTDTEIKGRLDAFSEEEAYANGNFTVTICPK